MHFNSQITYIYLYLCEEKYYAIEYAMNMLLHHSMFVTNAVCRLLCIYYSNILDLQYHLRRNLAMNSYNKIQTSILCILRPSMSFRNTLKLWMPTAVRQICFTSNKASPHFSLFNVKTKTSFSITSYDFSDPNSASFGSSMLPEFCSWTTKSFEDALEITSTWNEGQISASAVKQNI